jgi:hypothetical protein
MKNITEFNPGDEVVRIIPAEPYSPLRIGLFGETEGGIRDRSYMGEKLIFVGVANGQIYLKRTSPGSIMFFGDKLLSLALDIWSNGWENWIDPETLLGKAAIQLPEENIDDQITDAMTREDYKAVAYLRRKKELRNNPKKENNDEQKNMPTEQ